MVYRRRRRTGRRYNRRRRPFKKSYRRRNYSGSNKVYYFKRNFQLTNLTTTPSMFAADAIAITLGDLPNVSEFQNLYDSYQIRAIKLTFRPEQTSSVSLNDIGNAQIYNRFFSAIDYNNYIAPTNADILRQYRTLKVTGINQIHTRYWKPKTVDSNGSNPGVRAWLPCSATGIQHFGLRIFIEPNESSGGFNMKYSVEGTAYLAFKNVV